MTAVVFLALNGYDVEAPLGVLYDFVMALARGERTKTEAAVFLRKYSAPQPVVS
jgi:prophage maintenance system killer protein